MNTPNGESLSEFVAKVLRYYPSLATLEDLRVFATHKAAESAARVNRLTAAGYDQDIVDRATSVHRANTRAVGLVNARIREVQR